MKTLVLAAALSVMAAPALAAVSVGQPAPAFSAADSNGKRHSLAEYRGRTVVLEWVNAGCPFVQKHYGSGNMQRLQAEAAKQGAVWLTVNSGAPGKQGHVDGKGANAFVADAKARPAAYLLDGDGRIGRAYGATTTPHMYVVRGDGVLVYAGGIDDKPTADQADVAGAKNYVLAALADVKAGRAVAVPAARPYGCSVKY